ncbi:MAG TPA: ClpXP protease specificity-enhancing factor [Cycloclasticus sp.]|jgi:stringent starvation protein B|nr:ClpXP protease specificity-enhancing factor [Cycloclasticus sp.]HIL91559.1 ClpXP protease specificity-enhancing factor [Cycloclasticus sp.]
MTPLKPYLVRALHEWIIDNGQTPYLLIDAKFDGVEVPSSYISDNKIILNTHPDAIQDWTLDNDSISFSARFSGRSENLYIPINAVLAAYAKENGKGMMFDERFEDDMPPEPDAPKSTKKSQKPVLKIVK